MLINEPQKVAAIQMVSQADVGLNLQSAEKLIAEAAANGADMVLLPENFAVLEGGDLARYGERQGDAQAPVQEFLSEQSRTHGLVLVAGTIPLLTRPGWKAGNEGLLTDGRVRPSCLVFDALGEIIARYDKIHLFDVAVADEQAQYSESFSFEAGAELVTVATELGRVGLSICYDLRFPELYRGLFRQGAQILTVPSAFTRVTGEAHWEVLLRARAIENQCYVVAANQGGKHSKSRETWGHSMIIDPWGKVLSTIGTGEGVVLAEIDLSALTEIRSRMPIAEHIRL